MATYRTCIADAKTQKQELEDVKVNVLRQLQELIKQTDQILRSVKERRLLICCSLCFALMLLGVSFLLKLSLTHLFLIKYSPCIILSLLPLSIFPHTVTSLLLSRPPYPTIKACTRRQRPCLLDSKRCVKAVSSMTWDSNMHHMSDNLELMQREKHPMTSSHTHHR